jgi:hypothetical protein
MKWPSIEQMSAMTPLPEGFRFELLKRSDIAALTEAIGLWHPDIAVGGGSCYLRESFYTEHVYFEGGAQKNILVAVFRHGDELAGVWSWEQEPDALTLYARLIVIAPKFRSARLAASVIPMAEVYGRAMGAEFFFALATLKIPHMQHALESAGWQLIGFTSGYDQEQVAPGVVKRVFEGVYCKVLVPDDELVRPDPNNLTPRGRALFDVLFPDAAARDPQRVGGESS